MRFVTQREKKLYRFDQSRIYGWRINEFIPSSEFICYIFATKKVNIHFMTDSMCPPFGTDDDVHLWEEKL